MRVLMKLAGGKVTTKGHGQNVSEPSSENQLKAAATTSWPAATRNSQLALKLATMPQQQQQTKNEFLICPQSPAKCSWPFQLFVAFLALGAI